MVQAWNHAPNRAEADWIEAQSVVLTVPASFDDVARNLTLQASKDAGLKNVILLEEPQAAFYCWLGLSDVHEVTKMAPGMRCLVVDVGGGTSDFSLIRAAEETGELTFIREAVAFGIHDYGAEPVMPNRMLRIEHSAAFRGHGFHRDCRDASRRDDHTLVVRTWDS